MEEEKSKDENQKLEEQKESLEVKQNKQKSNKVFVIVIVVIAMALTFGCGIILGQKLFEGNKENKNESKNKNDVEINNNTYLLTIKEIINEARNKINEGKLNLFDANATYYIDYGCLKTENTSKSPYGNLDDVYVLVTYNGSSYSYYYIGRDEKGYGIKDITNEKELSVEKIVSGINKDEINTTKNIESKNKIIIVDSSCKINTDDEPVNNNTQEDSITYIDIKTTYVNKTNKKYNIKLAKQESTDHYALYDFDNKKLITDYDYSDGPYAHQDQDEERIFDVVEKAARVSVINVNNVDYIYVYVVATGFEDMLGYYVIYNPVDGKVIKGNTWAVFYENPETSDDLGYYYENGQFVVLTPMGSPEISEGWYSNASRTGQDEELIMFSKNGQFVKEKASVVLVNSNKTFTLYHMGSEEEFLNADYSNFSVKIYDIAGNVKKTYKNVVSVDNDYILVLEKDNLIMYDINGKSTIVEKNVAKDYIYNPHMHESFEKKDSLEIERQKKASYDGWSSGEIVYFKIK